MRNENFFGRNLMKGETKKLSSEKIEKTLDKGKWTWYNTTEIKQSTRSHPAARRAGVDMEFTSLI